MVSGRCVRGFRLGFVEGVEGGVRGGEWLTGDSLHVVLEFLGEWGVE